MNIKEEIAKLYPQVVAWRRQIHQNPELGLQEYQTASLVETVLRQAGVKVIRQANSTAVVGILHGGKPGNVVALRADMDALPLTELVEWESKSQIDGVMHACGHDMHTALLMGVAKILAKHKDEISGTVKFLFQPAEEGPGGAQKMIEDGAMNNPCVDIVFGLHVTPELKTGQIGVNYGFSSANTDEAKITVIGKGGHGAQPEDTVDAVGVAAQIVMALQTITSRNISALNSVVITVGSLHAGTVNNIIADTATLELTIRSLTTNARELLRKRIREVVEGITTAMGATYHFEYEYGYPSVFNDESAVTLVKGLGETLLGKESVKVFEVPSMGGEDFSYFSQKAPGAFFSLGAGFADRQNYPGHNPNFFIDEGCIYTGLEMMLNIVLAKK